MRKLRVSPAMAVAIVALVMAFAGTSIASTPIAFIASSLGLNGKQKKQAKSIADKEIKNKAGGLNVNSAKTAGSATSAVTATNALALGGQPPSAFFPASHVFSTGVKVLQNTGTATTQQPVLTFGPFSVTGTCTTSGSSTDNTVTLNYPAGSIVEEVQKSSAATQTLDGGLSDTIFEADSMAISDWNIGSAGEDVISPSGTLYEILAGWDAINYPTSGQCSVELLVVQG